MPTIPMKGLSGPHRRLAYPTPKRPRQITYFIRMAMAIGHDLFYVGNVTYLLEERDLQHATGSHDGHYSTVVLE